MNRTRRWPFVGGACVVFGALVSEPASAEEPVAPTPAGPTKTASVSADVLELARDLDVLRDLDLLLQWEMLQLMPILEEGDDE